MSPVSVIAPHLLHELMETARLAPPGSFVEVGVYRGGSAAALAEVAKEQKRRLYLFDTFSGMPFADPGIDEHKIGDFNDTSVEFVRKAIPNAIVIVGVFPDTLPDDLAGIALAHVDCDQYRSVKACCESLGPLMVPNGVMVFDDYDCLPGARCAVDEVFGSRVMISHQGKARVIF